MMGDRSSGDIIPFHSLLPQITDGFSLMVRGHAGLPDDEYGFFESYCAELDCDCRVAYLFGVARRRPKTVIAAITVGFEPLDFYREWLGGGVEEEDLARDLKGPALMPMGPESPWAPILLEIATPFLEDRREAFRHHYGLFKRALAAEGKKGGR